MSYERPSKKVKLSGTQSLELYSDRWHNNSGQSLLSTDLCSDCKIIASDDIILKTHKVILIKACPYFEKVLCGNFKEAEDKTIDLREDETSLVVALVKYIYGCQYDEILQPEEHAKLDVHVHLYGYADKFDYAPLRKAAFDYLSAKCVSLPFNAEMASAYLTAVNENCLAGGGAMLTVAEQFVSRNIEGLSGLKPDAFTDISRDCPHLGRMVLTHFTTGRGKDTIRWNCKSCKNFLEVVKSVNPRNCPYCAVGAYSLSEVKSVASAGD